VSPSGAEVLRQIKSRIQEVDPAQVREQLSNGAVVVDVREPEEWSAGHVPGAKHVPKSYLESRIEGAVPDRSSHVVLYCASGNRSAWATRTLMDDLGYENVESMTGGFTLWKDRGYEVETPRTLTAEQRERYSRHLLLDEVGMEGQQKLLDAKVLLLGAEGWAHRPPSTWLRPAWARWALSTTTRSMSPTSSARSSTPPSVWEFPRWTRPSRRSPRSTPTSR
jgi:rhodanese-related sulfurtransferase